MKLGNDVLSKNISSYDIIAFALRVSYLLHSNQNWDQGDAVSTGLNSSLTPHDLSSFFHQCLMRQLCGSDRSQSRLSRHTLPLWTWQPLLLLAPLFRVTQFQLSVFRDLDLAQMQLAALQRS